ncbi:MAG: YncE family protein [Actinobacteria bacterium]|nr:YncE family protein [Actinomycetota bacterium]
MVLVKTITGSIQPKSVLASPNGLVSAHNMMYKHSVTFYDSNTFELKATVSDRVDLTALGFSGYTGTHQGAPVEGAYSPDGKYLYVTNYAMYGKGFNHEGHDVCSPSSGYDSSFLYRINLETFTIDAAYKVGIVPKVVKVTPDNKYILVSHWCSYDLQVISVATQKIVKKIKIGAYPRGITVSNDSAFAYVAQMGGAVIHQIDLKTFADKTIPIGPNPRALVFSPDQKTIYATLNASGKVVALDLASNKVVKTVTTGKATRSLDISTDGTALFVVNFNSATLSKIRTSDFKVLQTVKVCPDPIGVTYEPINDRTWVACYKGSIKVFDNK